MTLVSADQHLMRSLLLPSHLAINRLRLTIEMTMKLPPTTTRTALYVRSSTAAAQLKEPGNTHGNHVGKARVPSGWWGTTGD